MKVLVFTNMYPSDHEPWFGSFVADQVKSLRAAGVNTDVLAFDGRRHAVAYADAARKLRKRVWNERFDLIHAHYGLTGAVALAQRKLPVVTTFHGSDTGYVRWQRSVSRFVAGRTTPIFVSEASSRALGVPGAVIPAAVDIDLFRPMAQEEARARLGWPPGRYALFPGAATNRRKRPDLFAAAVARAQIRLEALRPMYLEGLPRESVVDAMNAASVLVMTSDWEGSPVAVKEALACGTPVVSVEVGDVSDAIGSLPGCAVTRRDPDALADAIVAAVEQEPRPEELRKRAQRYAPEVVVGALIEVYAHVLR